MCVLALGGLCAFACQGASRPELAAAVTRYRALVYTKPFALRFALPVQPARDLGEGVHAIALRVIDEPSLTVCSLDLYLDDSIQFAYPSGNEGRLSDLRPEVGPLFFAGKLGHEDLRASLTRFADQRIVYRSEVYDEQQKKGVLQSGPISAFYRGLLPNLNVVEYALTCDALDPVNAPAELWLLRAGHDGTELNPNAPSKDVAHRVSIPSALLKEAAQATKRAAQQPVNLKDPPPPEFSVPK